MINFFRLTSYILLLTFVLVGCMTYNPATGKEEYIFIPTDTEVIMGWDIHQQIMHKQTLAKRPEDEARLKHLGYRIAQVSDRQDYEYRFYLIESDKLNAFTIPGGYIYFYTGLFDKLETDDQIAAVLAHEIAHGAARHVAKRFQAGLGINLVSNMIFGQIQDTLSRSIIAMGASALIDLGMAAYSREDELEADKLGVKYLYLAGYDVNAMAKTFETLHKHDDSGDKQSYFSTHPTHEKRIELIKKEIELLHQRY